MPVYWIDYCLYFDEAKKRRENLYKKWKAMGLSESKIRTLIERRIKSKSQLW